MKREAMIKSSALLSCYASVCDWMRALGYASATVSSLSGSIKEFMIYQELKGHASTATITQTDIVAYLDYLNSRSVYTARKGYGPGLGQSSINHHISGLKKLSEYLRHHEGYMLPLPVFYHEESLSNDIKPLTVESVKKLYEASYIDEYLHRGISLRDRAILALLYDCGLRRGEVINLKLDEVNLQSGQLYVHESKGVKSRIIPFSVKTRDYLEDYVLEGRGCFTHEKSPAYFLLNNRGARCSGALPGSRLRVLNSRLEEPLEALHPHLLRHSIATHLLASGMDLALISQFLGHGSLDVTERYTHLIAKG